MINPAKIYSTLGNPNSLIPLAVKDFSATGGMTAGSFVTGKEEGQDRLIDELGTEAIWLLGIPVFKWIFDKTIFKASGLDSKFDVRNLKNKDIFEKIQQYAPTDEVKSDLEKIAKSQNKFKNLAVAKFAVSTSLAIGSYVGLTRIKQKYTENKIRKNIIAEYNKKKNEQEKTSNNPSFKGLGSFVQYFAFSPVRNMWLLDGSITFERLVDSRTPQECIGYAIKEASTLCFMYYAGDKIQQYFEKKADEKYHKSIGLDARVLEDGSVKKAFDNHTIQKSLYEFNLANKSDLDLYEFIHKNPDNEVVKVAKKSDIVQFYAKPKKWYQIFKKPEYTDKIDTRKYIDMKSFRALNTKLDKLYSQYQEALAKGETSEEFFSKVKKLKRGSINKNIFACIFALGVATPAIMLAKRIMGKDDTEFKTKSDIRKQLIEEGVIKPY